MSRQAAYMAGYGRGKQDGSLVLTDELERAIENAVFAGLVNDIVSYNANERAAKVKDEIVALLMDQPGTRFGV